MQGDTDSKDEVIELLNQNQQKNENRIKSLNEAKEKTEKRLIQCEFELQKVRTEKDGQIRDLEQRIKELQSALENTNEKFQSQWNQL